MPTHTQPSDLIQQVDSLCQEHWLHLRSLPGYHVSETRSRMYPWQLRVNLMQSGVWQVGHPQEIHTALTLLHDALWPGEEIYYAALVRQVVPSRSHTDTMVLAPGSPPSTRSRCRSALLPLHSEARTYSTLLLDESGATLEEMWDAPLTVSDWLMEQPHRSGQELYDHHPDTQCRDYVAWHTRR